ncbi:MAG: DUF4861 family protein [Terriglobia bacterium]
MKWFLWVVCIGMLTSSAPAKTDLSGDWALPNFAQRLDLEVSNPSQTRVRTLVTLPVAATARIAPGFPGTLAITVVVNPSGSAYPATVVPSQADDLDGDGQPDEFEFPITLAAGERREVEIYYSTTLSGRIVYAQQAHASHAYGYNRQTATLESALIGYRTYGGFLLDVQARTAGHPGLYNDLVGFLAAHKSVAVGKDVFHVGDTLGLGGLFLRSGGKIYRPPFNIPDYAHRPPPVEVPHYRVVGDGPIRAIVEARLARWTIGKDQVELRAVYRIDAGEGFVRCHFHLLPLRLISGRTYEVGAGIRDLPAERLSSVRGRLALVGMQNAAMGPLGLALYYDPTQAAPAGSIRTPNGQNQVVIFQQRLRPGEAVEGSYSVAAAWSGSGVHNLARYLAAEQAQAQARVVVTGQRLERTPQPERIDGEAY